MFHASGKTSFHHFFNDFLIKLYILKKLKSNSFKKEIHFFIEFDYIYLNVLYMDHVKCLYKNFNSF